MKQKLPRADPPAKRRRRAVAELRDLSTQSANRPMMAELYRRAEAHLHAQQRHPPTGGAAPKPTPGPQRLLHELEVHQIELELQNAELQRARDELDATLENYTDLYDFAPVGYFSIDESGTILEANLTGATLLGVERSRLTQRRLPLFVAPASQPALLEKIKK